MSTEEKPAPQDAPPPATPEPSPSKPLPGKSPAYRRKLDAAGKTKALDKLAARSSRREARDAAPEKAYSVGDQLQKTSKPVSRLWKTLKLVLILVIVLGIPGIVTASFFVKVGKKKDISVAMKFWQRIRLLLGWAEPPKPFKPGRHPNLETLEAVEKGVERDQFEVAGLDKTLSKHDDKEPWPKEDALRLHEQLDEIAARIDRRAGTLAQLQDWIKEYNQLKGEAEKAHVEGIGTDQLKQDCIQLMLRKQPIPGGLKETAKDPGVQKYYELLCRMELDEYQEVAVEDARLNTSLTSDTKLRGQLRQLRSRLPSKMSLGVGGGEAPVKEAVAPFDPKRFHPWARAAAGTWVRTRVTLADGAVSHEDRVVKEVREDALVFTGQRFSGDQVTDDPEREEKFVPAEFKAAGEEKLKVGDLEVLCAVFQVGEEKRWIAREGRWANRVVFKTEKAGKETSVTKLGEEPLPFKERQFNCIAYEIGGVKFWAHEDIPGFVFKVQMEAMTREVVDFGPALAGRPPLPKAEKKPEEPKKEETAREEPKKEEPPKMEEPKKEEPKKEEPKKEEPPKEEPRKEEPKKEEPPRMEEPKKEEPKKEEPKKEEPPREEPKKEPPPKSVDVVLAEADKLLVEGSVIFREMVQVSKELPDDPNQLKVLLKRQEEGMALFTRAREAYLSVKDKASPEAKVEERLGKIEKILVLLQKYGDGIKSKLK
jgi:hypothetical protein